MICTLISLCGAGENVKKLCGWLFCENSLGRISLVGSLICIVGCRGGLIPWGLGVCYIMGTRAFGEPVIWLSHWTNGLRPLFYDLNVAFSSSVKIFHNTKQWDFRHEISIWATGFPSWVTLRTETDNRKYQLSSPPLVRIQFHRFLQLCFSTIVDFIISISLLTEDFDKSVTNRPLPFVFFLCNNSLYLLQLLS